MRFVKDNFAGFIIKIFRDKSSVLIYSSLLFFSVLTILGCIGSSPRFKPLNRFLEYQVPDSLLKDQAIILLEEDVVKITGDKATVDYTLIKKILKSGYPDEGHFEFTKDTFHDVISIHGRAIYPDGSERILFPKDIILRSAFGSDVLYDESQKYSFRFPGLRPKTVIQLHVKRRVKNLLFLRSAYFQSRIPTVIRRYVLIHPDRMKIMVDAANISETPSSTTLDGKLRKIVWEKHNIESFKPEEMMPYPLQYWPYLVFTFEQELTLGCALKEESWENIVSWYEELSQKSLKADSDIKTLVKELCPSDLTEIQKARIIFQHIKKKLRYVAIYLGLDGYRPHQAGDILKKLYGDCKDQSTVLISALREAGLRAAPVLVRTSDLGYLKRVHPSPTYFNHMIATVMIGADTLFLDPTCDDCSFGVLPELDQAADALIIADGINKLVRLPVGKPQLNRFEALVDMTIDSNSDAILTTRIELYGYYSTRMRRALTITGGRTESEVIKAWILPDQPNVRLDSLKIEGKDPSADKLIINFVCTIKSLVSARRKVLSVPIVIYPIKMMLPKNDNRKYPVDVGTLYSSVYKSTIRLSEGWSVAALPKPVLEANQYFEYRSSWETKGNVVNIFREWVVKNNLIPSSELKMIKDKYNSVRVSEHAEVLLNTPES